MSYKEQLVSIGPCEALVNDTEGAEQTVVLFHGYGADASDLFPLVNYLNVQKKTRWIFPEGSIEVPAGPGFNGRAWFPIDMAELEKAMMTGTHRDFSRLRPPGLNEARDKAMGLLTDLDSTEKLFVGGFSQGAMLATDLMMMTDIEVDGLVVLSGILLDAEVWKSKAAAREGLPFFQSHGKNDPLLDYKQASDLFNLFRSSGWDGEMIPFNGGHEIPAPILDRLVQFIDSH